MGMRFTERKTSRRRFDPFLSIKFVIELIKKNFHAFLLVRMTPICFNDRKENKESLAHYGRYKA